MPFIARCLKTIKRSNRHANLGNPGPMLMQASIPDIQLHFLAKVARINAWIIDGLSSGEYRPNVQEALLPALLPLRGLLRVVAGENRLTRQQSEKN